MQICDKCWRRVINAASIGHPCPIPDCGGRVIHVDDDLGLTVQLLNQKGWKTKDSCSGHPDTGHFARNGNCYWCLDNDIYIKFDKLYTFPSLPEGFALETLTRDDGAVSVLRAEPFDIEDPIKAQLIIWNAAKSLLLWANGLPEHDVD